MHQNNGEYEESKDRIEFWFIIETDKSELYLFCICSVDLLTAFNLISCYGGNATYVELVTEVNLCHSILNLLTVELPRSEVETAGNAVVAVKCHLHEALDPGFRFRRLGKVQRYPIVISWTLQELQLVILWKVRLSKTSRWKKQNGHFWITTLTLYT